MTNFVFKDGYRERREYIYLKINNTKYWRLGAFGVNVNNEDYVSLYSYWEMVHKSGPLGFAVKIFVDIDDRRMKMLLDKWAVADNARRCMIVSLFDNRKNKDKPPNPKTTTLQ